MTDATVDYTAQMGQARREHIEFMQSQGYVQVNGRWEQIGQEELAQ
jgi:16S rRNA U516 pseudouridylate synthase RsuA-like enzyme